VVSGLLNCVLNLIRDRIIIGFSYDFFGTADSFIYCAFDYPEEFIKVFFVLATILLNIVIVESESKLYDSGPRVFRLPVIVWFRSWLGFT